MTIAIRGDQTLMGYENSAGADVYGTAFALAAKPDPKICAQVTPNFTAEELELDTVGCGGDAGFGTKAAIANREYRVSLSGDLGFQNGFDRIAAQFFGDANNQGEQNVGQGDYRHIITFATQPNQRFGVFAFETSDDDVIEMKSTYTESLSLSMESVGQPIRWGASLVSTEIECDAALAVNDNTDLASLSFLDSEVVIPECDHIFMIKETLDDGLTTALSTATDVVPITALELELERPLEIVPEMTGGECNAPSQSGPMAGTLTVTFKEHKTNDELSFCDWVAGKFYVAAVRWRGSQINAGNFHEVQLRFVKLFLLESPQYNITDPGINEYSLVFKILDAENAAPPGWSSQAGVEIDLYNTRTQDYLLP